MAKCTLKTVRVDFNGAGSIRDGEKSKRRLENSGFKLVKTVKTGYNSFVMKYKRCPK